MWKIYALLSAFFAALVTILAKVGMEGVNSNLAVAVRTIVVVIMAWGIVALGNTWGGLATMTAKNWTFLIISGIATGLAWLFYFKALQLGDASKVSPIDKLSVAFAIVLAFIFLKEPIDLKVLIGGGLIVLGTLVLVL